ncbi:aminotransferase class I/II-fold pyridoxal phosphate-dependent enzyme [Candidatus Bathyarchaeota archaeon]|nr:aminotransferase class I/II-fold pyridoxal phosphate-dependent enzyme [Candidatus Bathyarchaeota archaeon]
MNIRELLSSSERIKAYQPNPSVDSIADEIGVPESKILKLDANENLFLGDDTMREILVEAAVETDPRLYPQDEVLMLRRLIAENNMVESGQVMVSAGGDQVIELMFSLLQRSESVSAVSPTFSMYPRVAVQRGLDYRLAPLEQDFSLNPEKTLEAAQGASLLVICNPNNPTGNQFPRETVLDLVKRFKGLVLIDEAYQEYSEYTLAEEVKNYDNLIILRTFSKAYGLAGLRLGYCISNIDLATMLRERYMIPYPVPNVVLRTGAKLIQKQETVQTAIKETITEREWLINQLNKLEGIEAYPSETNFVLFNTEQPTREINQYLQSRGVLIRIIGKVLSLENCLRVTVAPRPNLERFLETLKEATN